MDQNKSDRLARQMNKINTIFNTSNEERVKEYARQALDKLAP